MHKKGVIFLPWSRYRGIYAAHPEYTVRKTTPFNKKKQDRETYIFLVGEGRRIALTQGDGLLLVVLMLTLMLLTSALRSRDM